MRLHEILQNVQKDLISSCGEIHSMSRALIEESATLFFGAVAQYAKPSDTYVESILQNLLSKIVRSENPTRNVQLKIAQTMIPLIGRCYSSMEEAEIVALCLLQEALTNHSFVTRNGNALALAAFVRSLGLRFLKRLDLIAKLVIAAEDKQSSVSRQGAMLCFLSLSELLGRLLEPFFPDVLKTLLVALSDFSIPVRTSAYQAIKQIIINLSSYSVTVLLPRLLAQITNSHWRSKIGAIEALSAMVHCAPKQLAVVLPLAVPQLCETITDANPKVKAAAEKALETIASAIANESVQARASVLLKALKEPGDSTILKSALDTLLDVEFKNPVDFVSLSLIVPLAARGLRERHTESKRKSAAIVASMVLLCHEPQSLRPYFSHVSVPLLETLVDSIPSVRCISAKALGVFARILDEETLSDLLSFLLNKLKSSEIPVERSGAAYGLAEILSSLEKEKISQLLPQLLNNAEHLPPKIREGYIGIFVFLPVSFRSGFEVTGFD